MTSDLRPTGKTLYRIFGENDNLVIEVWIEGDNFTVAVRAPRLGDTLDAELVAPNHFNRGIHGKVVERQR